MIAGTGKGGRAVSNILSASGPPAETPIAKILGVTDFICSLSTFCSLRQFKNPTAGLILFKNSFQARQQIFFNSSMVSSADPVEGLQK